MSPTQTGPHFRDFRLPWSHNILVTVEEVEADCLQHIFAKALVTRAAGHRVVIAVASSYRQWKYYRTELNATCLFEAPPGYLAWGHAAGWPDQREDDKQAQQPRQTHSWRCIDTDVRAPPDAESGEMRRDRGLGNHQMIRLLFLAPKDDQTLLRGADSTTSPLTDSAPDLAVNREFGHRKCGTVLKMNC